MELLDNRPGNQVENYRPIKQLSCGAEFSCALSESGKVICWGGENSNRELLYLGGLNPNRYDGNLNWNEVDFGGALIGR